MSQNLSSAAVVIGALRVKYSYTALDLPFNSLHSGYFSCFCCRMFFKTIFFSCRNTIRVSYSPTCLPRSSAAGSKETE